MHWGLRRPCLPGWLGPRSILPKGKLTLSTASLGPQLHGREKKGSSLHPGIWSNGSSALRLRVPLHRGQLRPCQSAGVCHPHGEQTRCCPHSRIWQNLATADQGLYKRAHIQTPLWILASACQPSKCPQGQAGGLGTLDLSTLAGVSDLQPAGRTWLRMATSTAQHRVVNLPNIL